jgi:RNA polymerase sigma-70 factor (ECF subfamily)
MRDIPSPNLPEIPEAAWCAEARIQNRDLARRLVEHARPKVRVVAWLYHVDGFEQEEVAAVVGISRRTVVNRLSDFLAGAQRFLRRSVG